MWHRKLLISIIVGLIVSLSPGYLCAMEPTEKMNWSGSVELNE